MLSHKKNFLLVLASSLIFFYLIIIKFSNGRPSYPFSSKTNSLNAVITNGKWIKTFGSAGQQETWEYIFTSDGRYTNQIHSDFDAQPTAGDWKIVTENNRSKLILSAINTKDCYWLPCQVYIEYDPAADQLLVSGPNIVGTQKLTHTK